MKYFRKSFREFFFSSMQIQFFVSLVSLPVLVAWGLPFSVMTIIGNIIFTPFLIFFLLLSSILFFMELLHIPNQFVFKTLEKFFEFWMYCLHFGSPRWLYGIEKIGFVLCLVMVFFSLVILYHRRLGAAKKSWWIFGLLVLFPFSYQTIRSFFVKEAVIACLTKTVTITAQAGIVTVFDNGGLGEKKSPGTWIQYSFLADVIKICGATRFATITCPYPHSRTLEALMVLCRYASVECIKLTHPLRKNKQYKEALHRLRSIAREFRVALQEEERMIARV